MNTKWVACLLILLCVTVSGCGTGAIIATVELLGAAECVGTSLSDLNDVFTEVTGFLGALGGTLPGTVTYNETNGDYSITSAVGLITGNVATTDALTDGFDAGESASVSWSLNGGLAGAGVAGEGTFDVARTAQDFFDVTGDGQVVDGNCDFDVSNLMLDVDLSPTGDGPAGTINFAANTPTGPMSGTMTFDGSSTAAISANFGGESVSFSLNLDNFVPFFP